MKKSLRLISLLILLVVFFLAGTRFSQRGAPFDTNTSADRQILHYVDPMNPAHTAKEPGIAPCGMPMEPVYAEDVALGGMNGAGPVLPTAPGTVTINPHKQQIIGVQIGEAANTSETRQIRALGRIKPDENRVFAVVAATDGWLEEISESTTGSLVHENQLMAQIKVYNYDFFSWQQRYLTELGYTGRINVSATPISGVDQSRRRVTTGAGYQAGLPITESEARMIQRAATITQMADNAEQQRLAKTPASAADPMLIDAPPEQMGAALTLTPAPPSGMDHSQHSDGMAPEGDEGPAGSRDTNRLYSSKGRLELLNFGVAEHQLKELAENGSYITHVDLRSPVNGYVLSRQVSPLQKIESGSECFKIADLGKVWVEVDLYDNEAKSIQPGMEARISLPRQNQYVAATVSDIPPRFDAVSRSLKVRMELDNPDFLFRPDMFVDVQFLIPLPESITAPASAVIDSGKRKIVYVVREEGVFEPREVAIGWQTNDRVEIAGGLQAGDKVVVSGNFLIDSESRMQLAAARLTKDYAEQPARPQPSEAEAAPAPQSAKPAFAPAAMANKVKDPVCGMTVNQDQAAADGLTVEIEGALHAFCSADCKKQFEQDPQRFLIEKAHDPMRGDAPHHGGHPHD